MLNQAANTQNKSVHNLSIILYAIGFVAGLWLAGVTIWANMEASLFDAAMQSDETLDTLRCPALLSVTETGLVRATFHNGSERPLNFFVRANISNGYVTLMRQNNARLPLAPGESQELTWAVDAADAAYGRFVLVRVNVLRNPAYPTRDASCGIYLFPLPWLTGGQAVALALAMSLLGMGGGLALRLWRERPFIGRSRDVTFVATWLAVGVVAMMVAGLLRYWIIGVVLVALSLIMAGVLLERYVGRL